MSEFYHPERAQKHHLLCIQQRDFRGRLKGKSLFGDKGVVVEILDWKTRYVKCQDLTQPPLTAYSQMFECARGVRWDDKAFGIEWPIPKPIISERDKGFQFIEN